MSAPMPTDVCRECMRLYKSPVSLRSHAKNIGHSMRDKSWIAKVQDFPAGTEFVWALPGQTFPPVMVLGEDGVLRKREDVPATAPAQVQPDTRRRIPPGAEWHNYLALGARLKQQEDAA